MVEFAPHDRLIEALRTSDQYPYTLVKKTTSRAILEGYSDHLKEHNGKLFGGSKQRVVFWDLWPGVPSTVPRFVCRWNGQQCFPNIGEDFQMTTVRDETELSAYLVRNQKDPKTRHM